MILSVLLVTLGAAELVLGGLSIFRCFAEEGVPHWLWLMLGINSFCLLFVVMIKIRSGDGAAEVLENAVEMLSDLDIDPD